MMSILCHISFGKQMLTHYNRVAAHGCESERLCDHRNTIFAYRNISFCMANVRISPDIRVKFNYSEEIIRFVLFVLRFFHSYDKFNFLFQLVKNKKFNASHFMDFHIVEIEII